MDDEDSQDELINRNTSHCKGKRAAAWAISDDSDDAEVESEEGDSDSGEEEEEDGDEEEEIGEDEEEDEKAGEGACGGTSTELAAMSSDEDEDKCPICLNSFNSQPVATPENCEHYFCLDCILEWAKNANSCPVDRLTFNNIYLRMCYGGKVKKMITVQKPVKEGQEEAVDPNLEQTNCEVCGASDREDRLLLCDGCDAGYHMECLTPPLDAVPVEEWFCPECQASNRHSDLSESESLPSTARHAPRRTQTAGPTRAIARTQQSERVRANVNRHRITQARSSQLAPTYLIESSWLDETINAVVAGLNTAVYVRDFTPRAAARTRKRRTVRRKKTTSSGKKGKAASKGTRGKRRKVRRTTSRRKQVVKKVATARSRIAGHLGMAKDKKGSSLPTVYRPSEHTLSGMRADIGAASLSIYGDPFDLDPFADQEEEVQQARVPSLLAAKRRGISQSALRSHQPVARPVTASLSRRALDAHQAAGVVEAAPVPDLLGSILTGQSMLLMDSSDVIINRDGSLKASKPIVSPDISSTSAVADPDTEVTPVISPNQEDGFLSPQHHHQSEGPTSGRPHPHSSSHMASSASPHHSSPHVHPRLLPPARIRPDFHQSHRRASESLLSSPSSFSRSSTLYPESSSKNKEKASSSPLKKAPMKQMWEDVSVLPRIPKIKRDSGRVTNGSAHSNSSSNSGTGSRGYGLPETGMNSFAGDKGRQQSVDQHKGRNEGQARRPRPDAAASSSSSSSAFSNSFSSSSSSSSAASSHYQSSSSAAAATAVSFRINSSGNSWHSRRLNVRPPSCSSNALPDVEKDREEAARKKQLRKDKQMLLALRNLGGNKEEDNSNMYDPFNPTLSESCSSDEEAESTSLDNSSQCATQDDEPSNQVKEEPETHSSDDGFCAVNTTRNQKMVKQEASGDGAQKQPSPASSPKENPTVKIEPRQKDSDTKQLILKNIKVELDPGINGTPERKVSPENAHTGETKVNVDCSLVKHERKTEGEQNGSHYIPSAAPLVCKTQPCASSSVPSQKKSSTETKLDTKSSLKDPKEEPRESSSSESDRRRREPHVSDQGRQTKETQEQPGSKQHRRRISSTSDSSHSDGERRRKQRARSRSKERRHSRSASSSGSRERPHRKKPNESRKERRDGRDSDCGRKKPSRDNRRGRAHSRSPSRSRSRSRSRDRRRGRSRSRSRSRSRERNQARKQPTSSRNKGESKSKPRRRHSSRSSSRERRKEERSSKNLPKPSASRVTDLKETVKKEKEAIQRLHREEKLAAAKTQETSCRSKDDGKHQKDDGATMMARDKEKKGVKDIKKESGHSVDMSKGSDLLKTVKKEKEETIIHPVEVKRESGADENKDRPIKIEHHPIPLVKSESPSEVCRVSPAPSSPPPTTTLGTQTMPAVTVKQEVTQPSDDDDDFNVDVMLDSLDYEHKLEPTDVPITLEKEGEEKEAAAEAEEATVAAAAQGVKSKNQVKRVTWNIQEPEGPQPEKSSSKLALYKLKLKQEGLRRPASLCQTSGQDGAGAAGAPRGISGSSRRDESPNEGLSTSRREDTDDMDVSRKDKYLKKLHMQERAIEEVKLAIKPFYQKRDINKDEYKEILRKAVQKVCHSKSGEINPVKVGNLVKAYVDKYKHARKHRKGDDSGKTRDDQSADSP